MGIHHRGQQLSNPVQIYLTVLLWRGHPVTALVDLYHPSKNDTTDSDQGSWLFFLFLSAVMGGRELNACEHCDGGDKSQVYKNDIDL